MIYKTVIGVGQTGTRLAQTFATKRDTLLTFNTDHRDSEGIDSKADHLVVEGGAGKNYSRGLKIWSDNREKLEQYLEPVWDQDIIYFTAAGGGSGSSSVITFLNILLQQDNRVLLVLILPFIKESIPATSNAVRVMNRVAEFSNNMSVLIFSNDTLAKETLEDSFIKINNLIIEKTRLITDLPYMHNEKSFTPFAIDEGDHKSVAYSGGFMNVSYTDLEEFIIEKGPILPKFSYGNIKQASNVLITKTVPTRLKNNKTMEEGDKLLQVAKKIGSVAKSARILHGIIRSDEEIPRYITFATGLSIDKVFEKMKEKATDSALRYSEKTHTKETKKLERSEDRILDI